MCLRSTHHWVAPISSAASTYCVWRRPRVAARVTRKNSGDIRTPTATIDWCSPLPRVPTTAIANTVNGSIIRVSVTRSETHSNARPEPGRREPGGMPSAAATTTASRAPATEIRVPAISRLSTSRPR